MRPAIPLRLILHCALAAGFVFASATNGNTLLSIQDSKSTNLGELKAGQSSEQEINAGSTHSYRVSLSAQQYIHLEVEQLNINVDVSLVDPKGERVANADWWWREGTESLWALAESTGDYTITINVPAHPTEKGRYRVVLRDMGELQQASSTDQNEIQAHRLFAEASKLQAQSTADSLRKAGEKLLEARAMWHRGGNTVAEAQTLNELSGIEYKAGNLKQSIDYLEQALPLSRSRKNRRQEVVVLNDLAAMKNFAGETAKAQELYTQALPLARDIKDQVTEANILAGLGSVFYRLGQIDQALGTFDEMISLSRAIEFSDGEAAGHNNLGAILASTGRLREAIQHYNQTLTILQVTKDRFGQAATLSNIGNAYSRMGDFQNALDSLSKALNLRRETGDRRGEAIDLGSLGSLFLRMEDYDRAREYCDQSLSLSRAIGNHVIEAAALANLGIIYGVTGEWQKAIQCFDQALPLRRQSGDRNSEAYVLQNLGSLYNRMGDTQKALDYYEKALTLRRAVSDRYGEAYTLSYLGSLYRQLGQSEKSQEFCQQALTLARSTGDRPAEAATLYQLAQLERERGRFSEARHYAETSLQLVESTRSKVNLADVRAIYFASRQEVYDFYIDLLMQLYKVERNEAYLASAFNARERRSARVLQDNLAEARIDIRSGVPAEILDRERRLQQDLNAKADQQVRLLSRKHTVEQAAALAKEIAILTTDYEQALAQVRQSSPAYAALTQAVPLSLKEIQSDVLDPETVLLEYSVGDERSYLWTVSSVAVGAYELPGRTKLESLGRRVYQLLTTRNQNPPFETAEKRAKRIADADARYFDAAKDLSEMLLGPARVELKNKRLLVVADGILQYIPFAALPSPDANAESRAKMAPLIATHEILTLASASTISVLRRELGERERATKTIAVFADPVFTADDARVKRQLGKATDNGANRGIATLLNGQTELQRAADDVGEIEFPRLPHSRQEADAIASFTPTKMSKKSLDFQASLAAATGSEIRNYRIIHFATHGFLNSQHPQLSGIVLSLVDEHGEPQDGFLRLNEIYNLKLAADLVVLSACRTALGKEIKGEGLIGLTRGFMYAGAPRVVSSVWAVDDEITAQLMTEFYREMLVKKQRPAAALRTAQIKVWKTKRLPPFYWAGFVLQGEWR